MNKLAILSIFAGFVMMALIGAVLFGCAGRWDLPLYWGYLGTWMAATVVGSLVCDPGLVKERWRPGPGGKDYLSVFLILPLWGGQHVLAALDVGRFHWTDRVPLALQIVGVVAVAVGLGVVVWCVAVNRFFSSVIRIQTDRGHHLITGGPYRFVRHPAYAIWPLIVIGTGLALNSWLAVLLGLPLAIPLLLRTIQEDRILQKELPGYAEYAQKVRYRLVPGVW